MSTLRRLSFCAAVLVTLCISASAAEAGTWKAGTAVVKVTPTESMWMAGYAGRKKPSEGVALDLYCKALALEDDAGRRVVFVTCDLIGIPRRLARRSGPRRRREVSIAPRAPGCSTLRIRIAGRNSAATRKKPSRSPTSARSKESRTSRNCKRSSSHSSANRSRISPRPK